MKLIVNQRPVYFKLNNQAYKEALGDYQLILKVKSVQPDYSQGLL